MYIDRDLIKGLVASSYGTLDFNIDFVEYSVQKSFGSLNNLKAQPVKEKFTTNKDDQNRNQINIGAETASNCSVVTEQRYINIQDISDIRNISFYHNLIEKLREEINKENNRKETKIVEHTGRVVKMRNDNDPINNVFMMNNDLIWYNKNNSITDMDFFTDVCGEIRVIGYDINDNLNRGSKMLKAIAIYVE